MDVYNLYARASAALRKSANAHGLWTAIGLAILSLILYFLSIYDCSSPNTPCVNISSVNYESKPNYTLLHCNMNGLTKLAIPGTMPSIARLLHGYSDLILPYVVLPFETVRRIIKCDRCTMFTHDGDCYKIDCDMLQ